LEQDYWPLLEQFMRLLSRVPVLSNSCC